MLTERKVVPFSLKEVVNGKNGFPGYSKVFVSFGRLVINGIYFIAWVFCSAKEKLKGGVGYVVV
ncbi:MAG: hypothetical protein WC349_02050 [Patescibacteria group bacterium]|jgi:hypothetical protein